MGWDEPGVAGGLLAWGEMGRIPGRPPLQERERLVPETCRPP